MPKQLLATNIPDLFLPGMRVFVPGCSAQSILLDQILSDSSSCCDGIVFSGVFIPGVNRMDYAALHPNARAEVFFMTPDFRQSFDQGKVSFLPIPYSAIYPYLKGGPTFDLALIHVSPPDKNGRCSFGFSTDFSPAAIDNCHKILAHINPNIPVTDAPGINYDDIDFVLEQKTELITLNDELIAGTAEAVGQRVSELIDNGDTLQFGLGKMQAAVLASLKQHRDLKIHSGMISDPVVDLVLSGALTDQHPSITTGVALGTNKLYDFIKNNPPHFAFRPVEYTHSSETLRKINNMVSINSVIEIDLFGQANAETLNGRHISGAGGLVDFIRGARLAKNGRSILAFPASTKNESHSRIVPRLIPSAAVSVSRGDIDIVVTEYGHAELRHKNIQQRARALIDIAAPKFREQLTSAWETMQSQL